MNFAANNNSKRGEGAGACPVIDKRGVTEKLKRLSCCMVTEFLKSGSGKCSCDNKGTWNRDESLCGMSSRIEALLEDFQHKLGFTLSEFVCGLVLLKRIYMTQRSSKDFHNNNIVDMIFYLVTCLMLAHKISNDSVYSNQYFCEILNLNLGTINGCELNVLSLLQFNVNISVEEYNAFVQFVDVVSV
jgi:hypothetical protein